MGCGKGPKVEACVSDPSKGGEQCYNARTETSRFVEYKDTDNWVCFPPDEIKVILEWQKRNCK